jgi:hypothetical protein
MVMLDDTDLSEDGTCQMEKQNTTVDAQEATKGSKLGVLWQICQTGRKFGKFSLLVTKETNMFKNLQLPQKMQETPDSLVAGWHENNQITGQPMERTLSWGFTS